MGKEVCPVKGVNNEPREHLCVYTLTEINSTMQVCMNHDGEGVPDGWVINGHAQH